MITRRDLLRSVAGTVGLLGWPAGYASGEPPPETTRVRLGAVPSICLSSPQKILAQGTDWRFLNELKRELKS